MPLELISSSLKSNEESLVAYGHLIFDAKVFARSFRSISFSHTHSKDKSITLITSLDMLIMSQVLRFPQKK